MVKSFSLRYSLFLFFSDLFFVIIALAAATYARMNIRLGLDVPVEAWELPLPVYLMALLIWIIIYSFFQIYDPRYTVNFFSELQQITIATAFAWLTLTGLLYLTYRDVSRLQIIYFLLFFLLFIGVHRSLLRFVFMGRGGQRFNASNTLIVGTGTVAVEIGQTVKSYSWTGLRLVGFVGEKSTDPATVTPLLGALDDIPALVQQHRISEIVIALPWQTQDNARNMIRDLQSLPVNLRIAPDYFDMAFLSLHIEDFGGMPLITLKEPVLNPFQRLMKRIFDIMLTSLILVFAVPLMGVIALIIKLDSEGPIFFIQQRVGEGGRLFNMLKFRSMKVGSEKQEEESADTDDIKLLIHKSRNDPRVTRVGRFIRRTSLDELPQFFNILKGDMSLVGPRPEMPWLVAKYEPWQRKRFEVPQGLTGWWQINGRSEKLMHLSTDEDLFYIRNYSLWLDIKIILRTLGVVFSGRGAF